MKTSTQSPAHCYDPPATEGFLVQSENGYLLGPVAIRFTRVRDKNVNQIIVKATAVGRNGGESFASAADIASVVGRPFFTNETQYIGWVRLRLWLDHRIDTYQASCLTLREIYGFIV